MPRSTPDSLHGAPRLALTRNLSVEIAAIKNRPLYCVVQRATAAHINELASLAARLANDEVAKLIPALREWHIDPILGSCLTRKGAQNHAARQRATGFEVDIFEYSATEVRAACTNEVRA